MLTPDLSRQARSSLVQSLVTAGLWHAEQGGYEINDFLKYNPSHCQLEERRKKERERIGGKRDAT